ncbi:MAG: adenylate kinase [Thermoplasmatales archaeon]|nr:adenylate kinase [Thermoplasmatales archaeon]
MKVIVAGIPGAGKTTVLNEVKGIEIVNYGDVMFSIAKEKNLVKNRDEIRKLPVEKQRKLQKEAARKIAKKKDVIIDTHCTIKTKDGYMPGLPYEILSIIKPDFIVLVEADPKEIEKRRNKDKDIRGRDVESLEEIELHQNINRMAAIAYAALINANVKIVKNEEGKVKECAEEIMKVF